jgi:para-aminobenzoate synthetase component 1
MLNQMNILGSQHIPFIFIIDFDLQRPVVVPLDETGSDILIKTSSFENLPEGKQGPGMTILKKDQSDIKNTIVFEKKPVPFEQYKLAFDYVQKNLAYGNSYLANLTLPTVINTNLGLNDIYKLSKAPYKLKYKDKFVVFSPESFVQIRDGIISSYPMKGTINADIPNAEKRILENQKEYAEHATIVDLIRNDISLVAKNVTVERFRYIDRIETNQKPLLQVSSEITGTLPSGYHNHLGDIFSAMLPAGSISGAPKKKTLEIIKNAEPYDRGYYTGVAGIYDGINVDSFVMIRFIEKNNGKMIYKSGGGITVFSQAETEYREMVDKIYLPV